MDFCKLRIMCIPCWETDLPGATPQFQHENCGMRLSQHPFHHNNTLLKAKGIKTPRRKKKMLSLPHINLESGMLNQITVNHLVGALMCRFTSRKDSTLRFPGQRLGCKNFDGSPMFTLCHPWKASAIQYKKSPKMSRDPTYELRKVRGVKGIATYVSLKSLPSTAREMVKCNMYIYVHIYIYNIDYTRL